ncbi:MAG: helix-turn-helix domain-containing protein [Verrucomicrobiales bacterium]|nr:helix-turn-helix domain-containing protein [Verrucomicrobiales bacterium]
MDEIATVSLAELTADQRANALARYEIIRPVLEGGLSQKRVSEIRDVSARTVRRWLRDYEKEGLVGLAPKGRRDKDKKHIPVQLQHVIEGLALKAPPLSTAEIHCRTVIAANKLQLRSPAYSSVHAFVNELDPALVTLAHMGFAPHTAVFGSGFI